MTYIMVDKTSFKGFEQMTRNLSRDMENIKGDIQSAGSRLDWDILASANIEKNLRTITRSIDEQSALLNKMSAFLANALRDYSEMDNNKKQDLLSPVENSATDGNSTKTDDPNSLPNPVKYDSKGWDDLVRLGKSFAGRPSDPLIGASINSGIDIANRMNEDDGASTSEVIGDILGNVVVGVGAAAVGGLLVSTVGAPVVVGTVGAFTISYLLGNVPLFDSDLDKDGKEDSVKDVVQAGFIQNINTVAGWFK